MAKYSSLTVALMVITGTLIFNNLQVSAVCGIAIVQATLHCRKAVRVPGPQIPPPAACCDAIKHVDIPCACRYVTPALEKRISPAKAVYVARKCGVTVTPGIKCGSYVVPPPELLM